MILSPQPSQFFIVHEDKVRLGVESIREVSITNCCLNNLVGPRIVGTGNDDDQIPVSREDVELVLEIGDFCVPDRRC